MLTVRQRTASGSATVCSNPFTVTTDVSPAYQVSTREPPADPHACGLLDMLDVAASMLKPPADEIRSVTVVGVLPPGLRRTLRPMVAQIAARHAISAGVRFSDRSATVLFTRRPGADSLRGRAVRPYREGRHAAPPALADRRQSAGPARELRHQDCARTATT